MAKKVLVTGGEGALARLIVPKLETVGLSVLSPSHKDMDVVDLVSVKNYLSLAGDIDLLVCNAGVTIDRPIAKMSVSDWSQVMDINLTGAFRCAREVSRGMMKRRTGHIIFISSYSAIHPPAGQANYAAAKSALLGMMKSLAAELGPRNIRVNAILPGFLETKMTAPLSDSVKSAAIEKHALGRLNTPETVADFITFLHQNMIHTSGQVFNLDSRILSF